MDISLLRFSRPTCVFTQEGTALSIFFAAISRTCGQVLGSARVSRVVFGVAPKQSFLKAALRGSARSFRIETDRRKVREPETASPARETRALPNYRATGRGGGVGRPLGVTPGLGVSVGLAVGVAVTVAVAVGVGVGGW